MSNFTPITTTSPDDMGARMTEASRRHVDYAGATSYFASLVGPAAVATAQYRNPGSADVVAAAVNATAGGYGYGAGMYSGGAVPYGGGPSALAYGGGVSALHYPGHPPTEGGGAADMMAMAQEQLAQSQSSSMAMLMIQDEMGQQTKFYTSVSNLMNSRDGLLATIIRNTKMA